MPPELLEEVHAWLLKADHDLAAAELLIQGIKPLYDVTVYHCQQAAEKALKSYLTWRAKPFAKTHSLVLLLQFIVEDEPEFDSFVEHAELLTPFAWRFRYPGEQLEPTLEEAQEALRRAKEVVLKVRQKIEAEAATPP